MGTQIRIADRKTSTTSKISKTEHENIFGRNGKGTTQKKSLTQRDKSKSTGERRMSKKIQGQD